MDFQKLSMHRPTEDLIIVSYAVKYEDRHRFELPVIEGYLAEVKEIKPIDKGNPAWKTFKLMDGDLAQIFVHYHRRRIADLSGKAKPSLEMKKLKEQW